MFFRRWLASTFQRPCQWSWWFNQVSFFPLDAETSWAGGESQWMKGEYHATTSSCHRSHSLHLKRKRVHHKGNTSSSRCTNTCSDGHLGTLPRNSKVCLLEEKTKDSAVWKLEDVKILNNKLYQLLLFLSGASCWNQGNYLCWSTFARYSFSFMA